MGFSQGKLAKALGYTSPQIVSNWERGLCAPPMDKLHDLVKMLKVDKDEVVDLLTNEWRKDLVRLVYGKGSSKKRK